MTDARITRDEKDRNVGQDPCESSCPIERTLHFLGGKWTTSILWRLREGPVRFNELTRLLSGASRKVISERLRQLVALSLIERHELDTRPAGVAYKLSPQGEAVLPILKQLYSWAQSMPRV